MNYLDVTNFLVKHNFVCDDDVDIYLIDYKTKPIINDVMNIS